MFHQWLSTDGDREDSCIVCGVVAPETADPDSVFSEHGPLPITCPGHTTEGPHHFIEGYETGSIECVWCQYNIYEDTHPSEVEWECGLPGGQDRDEWLDYHYPQRNRSAF